MVDKVKGIFGSIVGKIKDIGQMVKDWIREKILGLKSWKFIKWSVKRLYTRTQVSRNEKKSKL